VKTMKIVSLRIFGALVGLGVLLVIVPHARSDDATDWANQQAQAQKEREDWANQQAQAQRDREQAERDQQERDAWQNQQAQAQKEREDWLNQQAQAEREAEQAQKERDLNEYLNQIWQSGEDLRKWAEEQARARQEEINQGQWGSPAAAQPAAVTPNPPMAGPAPPALPPPQPGAKQPKTHTVTIYNGSQVTRTTFVMRDDGSWHASEGLGIDTATPAAPVAGPMAAPQVTFPAQAIPQQSPMPLDPVTFQQMVRQNQERVRQQILQTQQQMMQRIRR
jgi:cell division protein FtsN